MQKVQDLTGKRFSRLLVVGLGTRNDKGLIQWKCRCDCGNETEVKTQRLLKGTTKSCGCLAKETARKLCTQLGNSYIPNRGHAKPGTAFRMALGTYQRGARNRGLVWELTDEQFRVLSTSPCYYTGKEPSNIRTARSGEVFTYNGIDRLDNSKGYTFDNCVPCCFAVNKAKSVMSHEEFILMCETVTNHLKEAIVCPSR